MHHCWEGKCYPFRPEQWPDVVLKGMDLLNRYNWFPFCTFILGLPGETDQDTKESLDLLFALKDAKWCVIPTLFVPLEETRLGQKEGASIFTLTDLQWEFFFTCWRYNIDFFRREPRVQWKLNLGIPLYYYMMGRKMFGEAMKYPLYRLAHFPERFLRRKLYLDFSGRMTRRYTLPEHVEIPAGAPPPRPAAARHPRPRRRRHSRPRRLAASQYFLILCVTMRCSIHGKRIRSHSSRHDG